MRYDSHSATLWEQEMTCFWLSDCQSTLLCRCVQSGTLIMAVKFGAGWTVYAEVITTSCFMAFYDILAPCYDHILWWKFNLLIRFYYNILKSKQTKFEVDRVKSVRGVKFCTKFKMADFLLTVEKWPEKFLFILRCYTCLPNFICGTHCPSKLI